MSCTPISQDEFQKFGEFFYRKTGIRFEESKRYFVDKRLIDRMTATNSENFRQYFSLLRFEASGKELQSLINTMTINETYFFREDYQFDCLVNSILPEICATKVRGEPIRIWVVPSSSGEEAYSIAICLLERWAGIADWDVEIVSSDIDTTILAAARAGLYTQRSIQRVPEPYLRKYFKKIDDKFQIDDALRDAVDFTRVNLFDVADVRPYRNFDVIFCRNLLIYFDDLSRRQAGVLFFEALQPNGFFLMGHSESMSRTSALFKFRKFPDALVYQRLDGAVK